MNAANEVRAERPHRSRHFRFAKQTVPFANSTLLKIARRANLQIQEPDNSGASLATSAKLQAAHTMTYVVCLSAKLEIKRAATFQRLV